MSLLTTVQRLLKAEAQAGAAAAVNAAGIWHHAWHLGEAQEMAERVTECCLRCRCLVLQCSREWGSWGAGYVLQPLVLRFRNASIELGLGQCQ